MLMWALNSIAESIGQSHVQMALSWMYSKPGVTSVLIGASNPDQITDNIGILNNTEFDEKQTRFFRIDGVSSQ